MYNHPKRSSGSWSRTALRGTGGCGESGDRRDKHCPALLLFNHCQYRSCRQVYCFLLAITGVSRQQQQFVHCMSSQAEQEQAEALQREEDAYYQRLVEEYQDLLAQQAIQLELDGGEARRRHPTLWRRAVGRVSARPHNRAGGRFPSHPLSPVCRRVRSRSPLVPFYCNAVGICVSDRSCIPMTGPRTVIDM